MPHPEYNGQALPVYSVEPNWKTSVNLRTIYNTIVRESLDTSEERLTRFPRCLYGLRYRTLPLTGQETGYIRRVLELAQALPVVMPVWTEGCRMTAAAALGATTLVIDDAQPTLFTVLSDYVIIWSDFKTWEVLKIDTVEGEDITLLDATTRAWPEGTVVYPILIGWLKRNEARQLTDQHGAQSVDFEERFNGLTAQATIETDIQPVEYDFEGEEAGCRTTLHISISMPEDETYRLQIAESLAGPWGDHVALSLDGSEVQPGRKEIYLNNDYGGTHYFRIVNAAGQLMRAPILPEAAVLAAPVVEISGVIDSPRPMATSEGFPLAYSSKENAFISPTALYVVPRARKEYAMPDGMSFGDLDGQILNITAVPGSIVRWTRDGSDPSLAVANPVLGGHQDNVAAHYFDFRYVVKVRCFKDGCASPMTVVLVDKRINQLDFHSFIGDSASGSSQCDLPFTIGDKTYESGHSCELNFGGPELFADPYLKEIIENFASTVNTARLGALIWTKYLQEGESSYIGWPTYVAAWTIQVAETNIFNRISAWNFLPRGFTSIIVQAEKATVSTERGVGLPEVGWTPIPPIEQHIQFSDGDADTLTGTNTPVSSAELLAAQVGIFVTSSVAPAFDTQLAFRLATLDVLVSAFDDFNSEIPPTGDPLGEVFEPEPTITVYSDDFESYLHGQAAGLNGGTGWASAWVTTDYILPSGFDDFEEYPTGEVISGTLDRGDGWAGNWIINEPLQTWGDDMQDYATGEIIHGGTLEGGEGWVSNWFIYEYFDRYNGSDDMQSYSVGPVFAGLNGGTAWGTEWIFSIEKAGYDTFQTYAVGPVATGDLTGGSGWAASGSWTIINY